MLLKKGLETSAMDNLLSTRGVSGHGGYHTANPETKNPKPYTDVSVDEIISQVKDPDAVSKDQAQWAIFSTTGGDQARVHDFQRQNGQYWCLWADLDDVENLTFLDVNSRVKSAIPVGYHIVYTSKSATKNNPKGRVLLPLSGLVPGRDYAMMAKIFNDRLGNAGLPPDRATERPGQLCYLPNRGEYYQFQIIDGPLLDPYEEFKDEIIAEQDRLKKEQEYREKRHKAAIQKAQERINTGQADPIEAFRQNYPVDLALERYGFSRHGRKWTSPLSESGKPGVTVLDNKWYSHHSSDAGMGQPGKDGGAWGDAFDLFVYFEHGGDYRQALKSAGEMFTTTDKKTGQVINLTQYNQREFMRQQAVQRSDQNEPNSFTSQERGKAEIIYSVNGSGMCCHEVSKQLGQTTGNIFRYGGQLVKIVNSPPTSVRLLKKSTGDKYPSMPVISHLRAESLTHEIEKIAVCKTEKSKGGIKNIPWPKRIIQGVLEMTEYHEKDLIGIVEHPYVNDDFKPVTDPGYDPSTGLYKCFGDQIRRDLFSSEYSAANYLSDEVFADFPFSNLMDRYAAVSCLLTGMQRKLISDNSGCPGYLFTAPVQSSGKTTLAQVISHSLYGRPAAASTFSDDNAEMAKHLLGILQEGHSSVLFDNLQEGSVVESNELAKVLTADSYSNRWLGRNQTITVPCSVLWMFTGNNVSVCGDFNTRILPIELDPRTANPDQRSFSRGDVGSWCEQNREKILSACMQVIMAGKDFNRSVVKPSRFPTWDKFVRFPLLKITGEDIGEIFQKNKQADPKIEGQRAFFETWFDVFGSTPVTAKEILNRCQAGTNCSTEGDQAMLEAIEDIFSSGVPTTRSLGKWLSGMKNRFFGDYKLIHAGVGTNRVQKDKALWSVQNCNK